MLGVAGCKEPLNVKNTHIHGTLDSAPITVDMQMATSSYEASSLPSKSNMSKQKTALSLSRSDQHAIPSSSLLKRKTHVYARL